MLQLAGDAAGTLSGFGTSIIGFAAIDEAAHAHWTLVGSISGSGSISIGTGAALTLDGTVSIAQIAFLGQGNETLRLGMPADLTSVFSGFGAGDTIDLEGLLATSLRFAHGVLTLYDGNAVLDTLHFAGASAAEFGLASDRHGGTDVVFEKTPYGGGEAAHFPRDSLHNLDSFRILAI